MTQTQQGTGGDDTITGTDPGNPSNADGIDILIGLTGDDTLFGLGGDDRLDGGPGNDTFYGGAGADTFYGGPGIDTASYDSVDATAGVQVSLATGNNTGFGTGGEAQGDILYGGIENLVGSRFNDTLVGNAEANALAGGAGDDSIKGGAGADAIDGGEGSDTVYYDASTAGVVVNLATGFGTGGDAEGDTLSGIENVVGSAFDDTLIGNDTLNSFDGGEGIDTVYYDHSEDPIIVDLATGQGSGYGDSDGDTYRNIENVHGTALDDVLIGDGGDNALIGADGNDTLRSGAGDDVISGGNGDDQIAGYGGADAIDGGAGVDTIYYDAAAVTVNLATGQGFGGDAQGDTYQNVENVVGTAFDDTLVGDGGDNSLTGGDGDDHIEGGAGGDWIDGGAGVDTADYTTSGAAVFVTVNGGAASGGDAQGDVLRSIENVLGSAFNDLLIGDGGANTLTGGDGDDTIRSGGGNDTVSGGAGNDQINAYAGADAIDGGAGIDTVYYDGSAVGVFVNLTSGLGSGGDAAGDTLSNVENLVGSAFDDLLVGNAEVNALTGGNGNDGLAGLGGADVLNGGNGIDIVYYDTSAAGVQVNLATGTGTGGDAQGDTFISIESVLGSAFGDRLIGDGGANALSGGGGDDTLRGGAGADSLNGGAGSDFANYQGSAAAVSVNLLTGATSGGDAAGDVLTSIENLYGSSNDDQLAGDNARNIIGGEMGNDTLVGNGGDDALSGEAGNDSLDGGDGADRLVGGAGIDIIHGGTGNDSVDAGSENDQVFGEAGHDNIYAGAGDDTIDGGDGNDIIEGDGGADTIIGGAGIDTAVYASSAAAVSVNLATGAMSGGDAAGDTLSGIEQVQGSAFADVLTGDANANTLWGLAGNDVLTGGGGGDALKGGAGNDRFVYTALTDSAVSGIGKDGITDFSTGDRIDLSAIDADGKPSNGDTAFTFGTGAFTGHAGELRVVTAGSIQVVYVDANGDKAPDFAINVTSDHPLTAADFVL